MLFSPVDPTLLMYCHEGPWQKVDRIWMIHTDGTHNELIHKRTMAMEIAGHEFWGLDGKTIWYDWQYPKGEDFFLAGYNLATHKRVAYHLQRNEWSIHFNLTQGETLFAGDGGDPGQVAKAPDGEWIELFRPQMLSVSSGALVEPDFWQPGVFHSEHLVNMAAQTTGLNPMFTFRRIKSSSFSPATCSVPVMSSASRWPRRTILRLRTFTPHPGWRASLIKGRRPPPVASGQPNASSQRTGWNRRVNSI